MQYVQQNRGWHENGKWGQVARSESTWNSKTSFFGGPGASGSPSSHYAKCWVHPE